MTTKSGTILRGPTTLNISGVSADTHGKVFAGYADNSIYTTFQGGVHFHQLPERPETPPNPGLMVPFRRDPDFVSRDTLLDQIHQKSSAPGARIALVGLGGVGKSQLAIEYSYRVRCKSPTTWVFWIHAGSAARFDQSFRDIADYLKIPGRQDPNASIFKLVENWLRDEKRGKWVLILDNIDDESLLKVPATGQQGQMNGQINVSTKPLLEYLPRSENGSIIATTRTRKIALKMVDQRDIIEIKPMESPEAINLLQRKLELPEESQTTLELVGEQLSEESRATLELVRELDCMPLAIVQAAGYIKHREPRCSISDYLETFRKSDREAARLLDYEAGHLYRDWEANNSILVTWQISFNHIQQIRRSAADLLSLMSFFDRQGISENVLRVQYDAKHSNSSTEVTVNDTSSNDGVAHVNPT